MAFNTGIKPGRFRRFDFNIPIRYVLSTYRTAVDILVALILISLSLVLSQSKEAALLCN